MKQKILILDFGSQLTQLIARKVREQGVYCEVYPYNKCPDLDETIMGIIFSGSPSSVNDMMAPLLAVSEFRRLVPLLGICYGAQLIAHEDGGRVETTGKREYGKAILSICDDKLFEGVKNVSQVWMSHGDTITNLPNGCTVIASTESVKIAAYKVDDESTYGLQFHPEVHHTEAGNIILKNFLVGICGCTQDWTSGSFVEMTVANLRAQLGDDKVVLGLSGGVDSSVAAVLLHKAIGANLTCIFVDNGLLRKNEFAEVLKSYEGMGLNVIGARAGDIFLNRLAGVTDPEQKRKIIGGTFIDVFDEEAKKLQDVKWLAQGTIYPDVIESVSVSGPSAKIKSHHNVGGLPEKMNLKVVEPLRMLFKDEVRRVGKTLEIDQTILGRHPFPGPGLAIRILGDITPEKVRILQDVDDIFIKGLREFGLYDKVWQSFAILLPVQSVGVMGDERTYENAIALRSVNSVDGMTADWSRLPHDFLAEISNRIINNVKGINRVVYDITSKPPGTIEWE